MPEFTSEKILKYCEAHTTPESNECRAIADETFATSDSAQMLVGPVQGMFLTLLARAIGAKRVLEIGTFTGYSALRLAEGLPDDGVVITCDVDPEVTAIARKHWQNSPHGGKIMLEIGPALDTIAKLTGRFDLVFIDADKENYVNYWEACVPMVRTGGLIIADNVLWSGRVLDPKEKSDHALVEFNSHVAADPRVDVAMLTIRDGVSVACKR
ncbi:MAG: class I SAM-dependent methyltransferase [Candidatus Latescibacterota bacterium]|nr:MAG: class I SAM-dependent methyltransferase [Candidatus Latescibacterota bacterium]